MSTTTRPDLNMALRVGLARLRKVTGVDGTMGGLVAPSGHNLVITENHHMLANAFQGTIVAPGAGLGGKALQLGRPVTVNDYLHAMAISHQYDSQVMKEQIHGAFAVPVRVGHRTRAVVYGLTRTPHTLGDRVLDAAGSSLSQLAHQLAVEIAVADRLDHIEAQHRHAADREHIALNPREIREELLSIAKATSDLYVRDHLAMLCDRLSAPHGSSQNTPFLLTRREREVLNLIALGMTNNEVAERLALMPTTVKSYLQHAMRKIGTRNRVETILAARRVGLIP